MIKVFIAEDDFRIASIHEQFLSRIDGVELAGKALNGEDTIKALKEKHVDLLLLDIYMPDKLGVEIITELRSSGLKHIDIIVITAVNDKKFFEDSIRSGIFRYLIKPVSLERFSSAIQDYKEYRNLLQSQSHVDQELADSILGSKLTGMQTEEVQQYPKGIDPLTLKKVTEMLISFDEGITTDEMGGKMGASRTTARRYLEYLVSIEKAKAELEYGVVGRPERKYYSK